MDDYIREKIKIAKSLSEKDLEDSGILDKFFCVCDVISMQHSIKKQKSFYYFVIGVLASENDFDFSRHAKYLKYFI